ncbi:hypothetical protein ATL39_3041 [Sinobaca qinghaiensis]|uniref:Uncharacterized protein n=1 Tax=Sinobaca qinghaiensis TaxID=342944 RepID=A0A419UWV5_9BACL|nr:hypothetical protein [Sinobaca qinghaiensis]RKD69617.1 hypothetical protein ATL39_3041 [Sinobaca qinghaiensis]
MSKRNERNKILFKNLTPSEKYQRIKKGIPFLFLLGLAPILMGNFKFSSLILYTILWAIVIPVILLHYKKKMGNAGK